MRFFWLPLRSTDKKYFLSFFATVSIIFSFGGESRVEVLWLCWHFSSVEGRRKNLNLIITLKIMRLRRDTSNFLPKAMLSWVLSPYKPLRNTNVSELQQQKKNVNKFPLKHCDTKQIIVVHLKMWKGESFRCYKVFFFCCCLEIVGYGKLNFIEIW